MKQINIEGHAFTWSFVFGSRQLPIFPGSAVRNRRAAALPFASLVTHWASASLDLPPAALGSALSAKPLRALVFRARDVRC